MDDDAKQVVEVAQETGVGCGVCCWPDPDILGLKKYNYKWLCMPSLPCFSKDGVPPPVFLAKDEKLPLLLAIIMGLQHALAMVAGIATSGGLLIAGDACFDFQKDSEMCNSKGYLVSAAWITSGFLTIIQVFRCRILKTKYYLGTGLVSVMGTSFTFLPVARDMVVSSIMEAKVAGECIGLDCPGAGMKGYGRFLGTCMVAAFLEIFLAMLPPRYIKKLFPPVVTGCAVMLIGGGLIGSGIKYVGGGVFCADNMEGKHAALGFGPQLCNENGDVVLRFGAPQYIGLACTVIFFTPFLQFFGSPFLKSTSLFFGLLFGMIVSGLASYEAVAGDQTMCSAEPGKPCIGGFASATVGKAYSYWNSDRIEESESFTFLWDNEPNPLLFLGFAPEYFLPILIGFFISTAETVGDIGLSCDASEIPSEGDDFDSRVQGGLLADGLSSFLAAIMTSAPNTTFSQNNGVIALTRCASRAAGFACAGWLILFGVVGKFGAIMSSVPICVVGGLVFMCFSMVFVGGIKIIASKPITRRTSYILTLSLGMGMGVAMVPHLFEAGSTGSYFSKNMAHNYGFWPAKDASKTFYTVPHFLATPAVNGRATVTKAKCIVGNYSSESISENDCTGLSGVYTDAVTQQLVVENCISNNGHCCTEYDATQKMWRTSIVMILKTPYCIGTLLALFLNLALPYDKEDVQGEI
mmetsp:Transcript_156650/g.502832  ORF Transcript_156650/g.502832 Transcript_156650/m.502832 type:complete len:692 (+) Transcript_156650:64-2139(+)